MCADQSINIPIPIPRNIKKYNFFFFLLYFKISYYLLAGVEEARLAVEGECDHGYQGSGTEQKKTRIKKNGSKKGGTDF